MQVVNQAVIPLLPTHTVLQYVACIIFWPASVRCLLPLSPLPPPLPLLFPQGAGTPLDHYLIPPTYIGIIDSIVQLRDKRTTEEEIHKILSRTVSHPTRLSCAYAWQDTINPCMLHAHSWYV